VTECRCQGLPTTSSEVESAVRQSNDRVKGTEKVYNEASAEELRSCEGTNSATAT
jgi:hypothetical protein